MDVCAFYKATLINGAKDNRRPGLRPHFGDNYYVTFIIDLDRYRIACVRDKTLNYIPVQQCFPVDLIFTIGKFD